MATELWTPLAEGQHPRAYAPGQMIYLQGTPAETFFYLLEGTARSYISSASGGERVLTTHRAGDLMGEASFFDQCPRVSSAVAVTACRAVTVDRDRLNAVFQAHPDLALPMLQYLARTVRLLSGHVDDMSFLRADQRLARHLLAKADRDGRVRATHEELGASVGVSRVTVSRVLGELAARGWVKTGYGATVLLDEKALRQFAGNGGGEMRDPL